MRAKRYKEAKEGAECYLHAAIIKCGCEDGSITRPGQTIGVARIAVEGESANGLEESGHGYMPDSYEGGVF